MSSFLSGKETQPSTKECDNLVIKKQIKIGILLFIGILGVWLIYWDITDAVNSFLHSHGIPPLLVGISIIILVGAYGIKVFK